MSTDPTANMTKEEAAAYAEALQKIRKCKASGNTILDLTNIGMSAIPPEIGQLPTLRELYLGDNYLRSIPPEIGRLGKLRRLAIHQNLLTTLPPEIGNLSELEELNLWNNQLGTLPGEIKTLTRLEGLDLSDNQLKTLPPQICKLKALIALQLNNNQLRSLPPEVADLTELVRLYLQENQLSTLPLEFRRLQKLERLNLEDNRLTGLPRELQLLPNLKELYLHGNRGLELPTEFLGPIWMDVSLSRGNIPPANPQDILAYYFRLKSAQNSGSTRPLNEAKVLFLGQPEAGKSSLIYGLRNGAPTPDFPQTDGIAREKWLLQVLNGKVVSPWMEGAERLRLNLWDFGGQEIYKATHTYFLTKRALYVIVTTARKDADPDLEEWLETAKTFGGGAPVWVVVNKHDENPTGGPDEEALKRKYYPMLRGFIRTQCQHAKKGPEKGAGAGLGLDELRDQLVAEAWSMEEVRIPMTTEALAIKDHLETMDQPTLTLTDYQELCAKLGEASGQQQQTLLGIWDKLGTVRYFPDGEDDEQEFKDTAILNPDWVTEAVYRVLMDPALKEAKGLVTEKDLARICGELKHTAGSHHLIRKVMQRFSQLYYTDDGRMFVPHLLENKEPKLKWPEGALRFVYKYPVLPAGLIPAFIAKMHQYHDKTVAPWLKGCVLKLQGCRVRVIGDRKARTLEVEVQGDSSDRQRDALDHVRYAMESMHLAFASGADVDELIPVPGYPDAPMVNYRFLRALERKKVTAYPVPANHAGTEIIEIIVADVLGGVRTQARKKQETEMNERWMRSHSLDEVEETNQIIRAPMPKMTATKAIIGGGIVTFVVGLAAVLPLKIGWMPVCWLLVTAFLIYNDSRTFFRRLLKLAATGWLATNGLGFTLKLAGKVEIDWSVSVGFNLAAALIVGALVWAAIGEGKRYPVE